MALRPRSIVLSVFNDLLSLESEIPLAHSETFILPRSIGFVKGFLFTWRHCHTASAAQNQAERPQFQSVQRTAFVYLMDLPFRARSELVKKSERGVGTPPATFLVLLLFSVICLPVEGETVCQATGVDYTLNHRFVKGGNEVLCQFVA
jgi:hypothetical protein